MIQHTKFYILFILLLVFTGCKDNTITSEKKAQVDTTFQNKQTNTISWKFSSIYPIGKQTNDNIENIKTFYKSFSFNINNDKTYFNNSIDSEELYSNRLASEKYFKEYLKTYYETLFLEKFNLNFPDSVIAIRRKDAHKQNSILKPYFDDAFIADQFLVIQKDGFSIFFEKISSQEKVVSF